MYDINNKVYKMGPKLGLCFPKKFFINSKIKKHSLVEIVLKKNNKKHCFITRINDTISLRNDVKNNLNLKTNDRIDIFINPIKNLKRTNNFFVKNKIDVLSLIPEKTTKGYEIVVSEFCKNSEKWLKIWYSHKSGSCKEIDIRRYVNIVTMGRILGQIQAEGTKSSKHKFRLDFTNKLIEEHKDFSNYLEEIGIDKKDLRTEFISHRAFNGSKEKIIEEFEKTTRVKVYYFSKSQQRGNYYFKTYIRSTVLTEIFMNMLDEIRKSITKKFLNENSKIFAEAFFAKLLTGDGTIDITLKNRQYNYPAIRIKIVDINYEYLKDYAKIMKNLGFNPTINKKYIYVKSICSLEKLFYLYKIKAFKNTNNWNKLIIAIGLCLQGRRYLTYWRFLDLVKLKTFTSIDLKNKYDPSLRSALDWLHNKEKEGLIKRIRKSSYPSKWIITQKGKNLATTLSNLKKDIKTLKTKYKELDLPTLLNKLKVR